MSVTRSCRGTRGHRLSSASVRSAEALDEVGLPLNVRPELADTFARS
jgi:hypothetical protein